MGSGDFARIRLGVGQPESAENLTDYVLKRFPAEACPSVERMVTAASAAVCRLLGDGVAAAMNEYNGRHD